MFCKHCGTELPDDSDFCSKCGGKVRETASGIHVQAEEVERLGGKWPKTIAIIAGVLIILGIIIGIEWYFESGNPLVLFVEFSSLIIGLILLVMGLKPGICNNFGVKTKDKYNTLVIVLIVLWLILVGIEPEPPQGWWNY